MSEPLAQIPLDINLNQSHALGPEWVFQGELRDSIVFKNSRTERLLLIPKNGIDPPSEWGLLK